MSYRFVDSETCLVFSNYYPFCVSIHSPPQEEFPNENRNSNAIISGKQRSIKDLKYGMGRTR